MARDDDDNEMLNACSTRHSGYDMFSLFFRCTFSFDAKSLLLLNETN